MMTSSNPGPCDGCGMPAETRDADDHCLDCEYSSLQHDMYAGEVIEKVLGGAVDSALEYLAPSDVYEIVALSLKRTGCDGAYPLAVVKERAHRCLEARIARIPGADATPGVDSAIPLTAEQVGVIHNAIERHMLGLGLDGDLESELRIISAASDAYTIEQRPRAIARLGQAGRSLSGCAKVLPAIEQGEFPLDDDARALLAAWISEVEGGLDVSTEQVGSLVEASDRGLVAEG